jgi:putative CocE/NonD family hydrolase
MNEVADGEATLDWLAQQPWHNGVLGMWGPSYVGYVQWAAATARPDAFQALCPIVASSRGAFTGDDQDGFPFELVLRWMVLLDALNSLTGRERAWEPWRGLWRIFPFGQTRLVRPAFNHLPLQELDRLLVGREVPHYRRALQPAPPALWAETDRRPLLDAVEAPVHLIGGWYDFMLDDLLADCETLRAAGHEPYLTVGPWHHLDNRLRGISLRLGLAWFDTHLKGRRERISEEPVRLYMLGADRWRNFSSWPPPASCTRYYLQEAGALARALPPANSRPDQYHYDPTDPTPAVGGARFIEGAGQVDNSKLEARPDVLTYTSLPLTRPLEIAGPVRAELFVRSSLAHTDFFARLCDVDPSGRSLNLCDGLYRVEPGKGEPQADGSLRLEVKMSATAHQFRAGHRIRLQLSSGAHPRHARNLGTGAPRAEATQMRVALQTIYHDEAHPSTLVLPVIN